MRRVSIQLIGEVLTRPMLIVTTLSPKTTFRYVIYKAIVCDPYFFPVLPIPKSELGTGESC